MPVPAWNKKDWVNYMCIVDRMADRELTKLLLGESQTFQNEFTNYMSLSPEEQREIDDQDEIDRQAQEKDMAKWFLLQIKYRFPDDLERIQGECVGLEKWSDVTELLTNRLLELMENQKNVTGGTLWHKAFMEKYPTAVNLGGGRYLIKGKTIVLYSILSEDLKVDRIILPDPDSYLYCWICFYGYSVKLEQVAYIGWYELKELPVETHYLIIPLSEIKK